MAETKRVVTRRSPRAKPDTPKTPLPERGQGWHRETAVSAFTGASFSYIVLDAAIAGTLVDIHGRRIEDLSKKKRR